ncbi:MAG: hypothetical protein U0930_08915 [Pirellulales bacterium]
MGILLGESTVGRVSGNRASQTPMLGQRFKTAAKNEKILRRLNF